MSSARRRERPPMRHEQPSTYVVADRSSEEEMTRLHLQDQLLTSGMGGVFPEQSEPERFQQILDVGCATGSWLLDTAHTYPSIARLVGVDISQRMISYAQAQAQAQHVSDRVEFRVMDALRMLDFPTDTFDLVNHRAALSWLRTWDWPNLLQTYRRVARAGGVVRCTEGELVPQKTSSPAVIRLCSLMQAAFYQSGHLFGLQNRGLTDDLPRLIRAQGFQQVQSRLFTLEYRAGTPEGERFCENIKLTFRTVLPFLHKWIRVPDDYEVLYQQMLQEIQQPDFLIAIDQLTVWAVNPSPTPAFLEAEEDSDTQ